MNINFNTADCLETSTFLTYSEVHNLCSGTVHSIPHGFWDYVIYCGVTAVIAMVFLLIFGFAVSVIRGY